MANSESDSKRLGLSSSPCDASREGADVRDEHPCDGAGDRGFEVLGESSAAAQPRECSFDNPAAWQKLEALGHVRTLDNFQGPCPFAFQRGAQFVARVAAIGEDVA